MRQNNWAALVQELQGIEYRFGLITADTPIYRIQFSAGLSDTEILSIETQFGFRFPPDLRSFLQTALPLGPRFPDWRSGDVAELQNWLDLPREGVLFEVENNGFWLSEWGPRLDSLDEALRVTNRLIDNAPRLIPIFGHRMIPDDPHESGNPIFSVHQTDIICYGNDLADYFRTEFQTSERVQTKGQIKKIRFWDIDRFQKVRWQDGSCVFDNR